MLLVNNFLLILLKIITVGYSSNCSIYIDTTLYNNIKINYSGFIQMQLAKIKYTIKNLKIKFTQLSKRN